jgi:hypothetical protein
MIDLEEIVREVSYRCKSGSPNWKNKEDISILSEVLSEMGYGSVKHDLIRNLTEGPNDGDKARTSKEVEKDQDKNDRYHHKGNGIYVKDADKDKDLEKVGNKYTKDDKGNYRTISDDDVRKIMDKNGEEGGSNNNPEAKPKDGEPPADVDNQEEIEQQQNIKKTFSDPDYQAHAKEAEMAANNAHEDTNTKSGTDAGYKKLQRENSETLNSFITTGFDESDSPPGNKGSMLNEITSIVSSTDYLNNKESFNYSNALEQNVNKLKGSTLGNENEGTTPAGRIKIAEARLVAQQYDISVGLASKIIIATKAANKKHGRIVDTIINKYNLQNFEAIPLFGDQKGLDTQVQLVTDNKNEIKLGDITISKEEAEKIIRDSGGGSNPSDTAIFVLDKDTGNLHMSFFSDKDSTKALVAQSSLSAENELKKEEINELVTEGILTNEESQYYINIMNTSIETFKTLEDSLSQVVQGPGKHLRTQDINELTNLTKTISKGKNADKYWKNVVVKKFTSTRNPAYKKITPLLADGHQTPPTDNEMMEAYVKYINLPENEGNLPKPDQRVITDLSNRTNGPKMGGALGEIRKKSINTDLDLIKKLDEKTINIGGNEVGLGTYLEAKSVFEKLHLDMLFGGEGVYQDPNAFCQENGGVTIDSNTMKKCLPFHTKEESFAQFEVGEEVDQVSRNKNITGSTKIVYAIDKDGTRHPIGEKKQRSKQGPLGKLNTVYNFHPSLQKCFDKHGK